MLTAEPAINPPHDEPDNGSGSQAREVIKLSSSDPQSAMIDSNALTSATGSNSVVEEDGESITDHETDNIDDQTDWSTSSDVDPAEEMRIALETCQRRLDASLARELVLEQQNKRYHSLLEALTNGHLPTDQEARLIVAQHERSSVNDKALSNVIEPEVFAEDDLISLHDLVPSTLSKATQCTDAAASSSSRIVAAGAGAAAALTMFLARLALFEIPSRKTADQELAAAEESNSQLSADKKALEMHLEQLKVDFDVQLRTAKVQMSLAESKLEEGRKEHKESYERMVAYTKSREQSEKRHAQESRYQLKEMSEAYKRALDDIQNRAEQDRRSLQDCIQQRDAALLKCEQEDRRRSSRRTAYRKSLSLLIDEAKELLEDLSNRFEPGHAAISEALNTQVFLTTVRAVLGDDINVDELNHAIVLQTQNYKAWRNVSPVPPEGPGNAGRLIALHVLRGHQDHDGDIENIWKELHENWTLIKCLQNPGQGGSWFWRQPDDWMQRATRSEKNTRFYRDKLDEEQIAHQKLRKQFQDTAAYLETEIFRLKKKHKVESGELFRTFTEHNDLAKAIKSGNKAQGLTISAIWERLVRQSAWLADHPAGPPIVACPPTTSVDWTRDYTALFGVLDWNFARTAELLGMLGVAYCELDSALRLEGCKQYVLGALDQRHQRRSAVGAHRARSCLGRSRQRHSQRSVKRAKSCSGQ